MSIIITNNKVTHKIYETQRSVFIKQQTQTMMQYNQEMYTYGVKIVNAKIYTYNNCNRHY